MKASCFRLVAAAGGGAAELEQALRAAAPVVVADRIASAVIPDPELRQELLETLNVRRRLERLAAGLEHLLRDMRPGRG